MLPTAEDDRLALVRRARFIRRSPRVVGVIDPVGPRPSRRQKRCWRRRCHRAKHTENTLRTLLFATESYPVEIGILSETSDEDGIRDVVEKIRAPWCGYRWARSSP